MEFSMFSPLEPPEPARHEAPQPESFSCPTGAAETELPFTDKKASDMVPEPYNFNAESRQEDQAAAEVYEQKARLHSTTEFTGPDMAQLGESYARQTLAEFTEMPPATFEGASDPNDVEKAILAMADAGINHIGRLANVEPQPADGAVYMFERRGDYNNAYHMVTTPDDTPNVGGGLYIPLTGMLWFRRPEDPRKDLVGMTHERVHQRSQQYVIPQILSTTETEHGKSTIVAPGRSCGIRISDKDRRNPELLNETVTDMATNRILREAGQTTGSAYRAGDIILEEIIEETAGTLGVSEQNVEFALYRDLFGGSREGTAMIRDALGSKRTDLFFSLPNDFNDADAPAIAAQLGLPFAAAYIQGLLNQEAAGTQQNVHLFAWQPRDSGQARGA